MNDGSIRRSVVRGSAWTITGFAVGQAVRLGANIVLAALLFEEAFALIAITFAIMQGMVMFSDFGLGPSVVQNPRGDDPEFLNTAWTLQVLRGVVLAAALVALAWPLAAFYSSNDPTAVQLRYLLPIAALSSIFSGLQSANVLRAQRHIQLGRLTLVDLISQIAGAAVMIGGAWLYRSAAALAVGAVTTAAVQAALSHVLIPGPRSHIRWHRESVSEIIHFGKWMLLSTAITFLTLQMDKLALGKIFPFDQVGVYGIAANLALLAPTVMGRLQGMIAFPLFARTLAGDHKLEPTFDRLHYPMLAVGGYIVAVFIATAQAFVGLAYDHRYAAAATFIPVLSVGAWFAVIHGSYLSVMLALGQVRLVAVSNAAKVVVFCALLLPATRLGGILGAAVLFAASDLARAVVLMFAARHFGIRSQLADVRFTLYTIAVGGVVAWLTGHLTFFQGWRPVALLAVQVAVVSAAFLPPLRCTVRTMLK